MNIRLSRAVTRAGSMLAALLVLASCQKSAPSAAFDEREPAEKLAARLSDEFGCQTMVAPVELNGNTIYRVRMLVRTKLEAENLADALASKANVKAWIDPLP